MDGKRHVPVSCLSNPVAPERYVVYENWHAMTEAARDQKFGQIMLAIVWFGMVQMAHAMIFAADLNTYSSYKEEGRYSSYSWRRPLSCYANSERENYGSGVYRNICLLTLCTLVTQCELLQHYCFLFNGAITREAVDGHYATRSWREPAGASYVSGGYRYTPYYEYTQQYWVPAQAQKILWYTAANCGLHSLFCNGLFCCFGNLCCFEKPRYSGCSNCSKKLYLEDDQKLHDPMNSMFKYNPVFDKVSGAMSSALAWWKSENVEGKWKYETFGVLDSDEVQ